MVSRPSDLVRGAILGAATSASSLFYIENAGGLYSISRAQLAAALRAQGALVTDPAFGNRVTSWGMIAVYNTGPEIQLARSDNGQGWTMFNWSAAGDRFALGYLTAGSWAANTLTVDRFGSVEIASGLGVGGGRGSAYLRSIVPDEGLGILISGATKGVRIVPTSTGSRIEGVDASGVGTFQPLTIGGSVIYSASSFRPSTDGIFELGGAGARWSVVYASTGSINTSGRETKRTIRSLRNASLSDEDPEKVRAAKRLRVGARLAQRVASWQFADSILEKGQAAYDALPPEERAQTTPEAEGLKVARYHVGWVFDEVVAAFEAEGLDPYREGAVCRDKRMVTTTIDEPGEVQEELEESYNEFEIVVEPEAPGRAVRRQVKRTRKAKQWINLPLFDDHGLPIMIRSGRYLTTLDTNGDPLPEMVQATHPAPKMVTGTVPRTIEEWDGTYVEALRENHLYALCIAAMAAGVTIPPEE